MLFSWETKTEIIKRKEWGFFIHKFQDYGKCLYDRDSKAIGLGMIRYKTLYELIRGINHEILHKILQSQSDKLSGELDNIVHNKYQCLNSVFKEELYELQRKTWKDISVVSFLFQERVIRDYFEIKKLIEERNLPKSVVKRLIDYMKKKLQEASVDVLSPNTSRRVYKPFPFQH